MLVARVYSTSVRPSIPNRLKSVLNGEQAPAPPFVHRVLGIVRVPHRGHLADRRHRGRPNRRQAVGMADLLTATLAAAHQLTVVHYDTDFETAVSYWPSSTNGSCHEEASRQVLGGQKRRTKRGSGPNQ